MPAAEPTRSASESTTTKMSRRRIREPARSSPGAPHAGRAPSERLLALDRDETHKRHDHEEDGQHDGELEQPLLDTPPAPIDRGIPAERGGEPGAARLQQDSG